MQWLQLEEYKRILIDLYGSKENATNILNTLKHVVSPFLDHYPNPLDWLNTPLKEKKQFKHNSYTEVEYIIAWYSLNKDIFDSQDFNIQLTNYFISRRKLGNQVFTKWAKHFNLVLDLEFEALRKIRTHGSPRNSLAIHTLIQRKPFKDFTDEDLKYAANLQSVNYNILLLQKLRYQVGYSNNYPIKEKSTKKNTKELPKRFQKRLTWDDLYNHPIWGETIKSYYDYMIIGDAHPGYIENLCLIFEKLLAFLDKQGLRDFSNFTYLDYLELTEHLSWGVRGELLKLRTIVTYTARVKRLFIWGQGKSLFPTTLDFPNEEWSKMIKESHIEYRKSQGLAFSSNEIAEELVKTIYNYKPDNEIETLCRYFWMITASSTPRLSFILDLEASNCLKSMPNEPHSYGLYSPDEDKAGNKYGQFPILDSLGTEAIKELEQRKKKGNFSPIYNERANREYIHLFQLTSYHGRLTRDHVTNFLEKMKDKMALREDDGSLVKASAHRFRTFLLTHIAVKSGDIEAVRIAAGHKDEQMTRLYLRSNASRNSLLSRIVQKYENNEITGRFYFRIISLLSAEYSPVDEMIRSLATDISIEEFLSKYGQRLDMGYCMSQNGCDNWFKCWGCGHFLIRKEEIEDAIKTLALQVVNMREMINSSSNFTRENPIAAGQIKTITLIIKRLTELGLSKDDIDEKLMGYFQTNSSRLIEK